MHVGMESVQVSTFSATLTQGNFARNLHLLGCATEVAFPGGCETASVQVWGALLAGDCLPP